MEILLKYNPKGQRQIFVGDRGITYLCIQTKAGSLEEYTATDAVMD